MILSRMIMCSIASWRRLSFNVWGKLSRLAFQSSISISSCPLKDLAVISWIFAKQIDFRLFIFTDDFEFSTSSTKNVCVFKSTMISRKISKKMKNETNENHFFFLDVFFRENDCRKYKRIQNVYKINPIDRDPWSFALFGCIVPWNFSKCIGYSWFWKDRQESWRHLRECLLLMKVAIHPDDLSKE